MFRTCHGVAKISIGLIALFLILGGMSVNAQEREGKVIVTDSVESEEDYSNKTLTLSAENPKVVIKWDIPVENPQEFHVYIKPKEAEQSVFLGRVEANDNTLIWEQGARNINPTFREGPKEGIYTFRVFTLIPGTPRPKVYGPVPNDGPVKIVIGSDLRPTRVPTFPPIRTKTPSPTPTPKPSVGARECVEAGDVFSSAASGLSTVNLGMVSIEEALLPDGSPVNLNVTDCDSNGKLDVEIPWSESNATRKATITFSSNVCNGNAPKVVELYLRHGTPIKLEALDDSGSLVDTASNSSSDPSMMNILVLSSSTGIREIKIDGAEICLLRICWYCRGDVDLPTRTPQIEPTIEPGDRVCVDADEFFNSAASGLSVVNLGGVSIREALLPDGSPVSLNVTDCDNDGQLDVEIPWSESNATRKAVIKFSPNVCNGNAPKVVEIFLRHGTAIKLEAIDDNGSIVDAAGNSGSDPSIVDKLVLTSATGIREILVEGAEICLLRICWYCRGEIDKPTPTFQIKPSRTPQRTPDIDRPTRTPFIEPTQIPGGRECVEAGDVYTSETTGLSTVNLGAVSIKEALLPDGSPVPLDVTDCDNDGHLDVEIPWSESNATQNAVIQFSPNVCNGNAPEVVEVFLRHGTAIKLEAYDDNGVLVDSKGRNTSDPNVLDVLLLNSATGIREIKIIGAEICLLRICWYCRGDVDRPTRTPFIEPTKYPEDCDCAEAGDIYTSPASGLSVVNLGLVNIQEALLPDGSAVNLNVTDCDSDGRLDIEIPWSESNATRNAVIEFSPNICNGNAPKVVELVLRHGTQIKLQAFDDSGALVDTAVRLSSDPSVVETIGLFSSSGIREIVIEGAEICLHRICWCCRGDIERPTPTFQIRPTRTPPVVIRTRTPTPDDIVRPTPVIPVGEVVVLDNMESYHDLSNGVDVDPKGEEALVLRWKDNENVIDAQEYHIYVSVDNNERLYLGQIAGSKNNVFRWAKEAPGLNKVFADGPKPGHTYMFTVFGLTGRDEVKIAGPYRNAGPVKFMVGEETPSIRFLGWQNSTDGELKTNILVVQANKPNQRVCLAYHVGDSLYQNCFPLPLGTELRIPIRIRHSNLGEVNVTAVIQEKRGEDDWVNVDNSNIATSPSGQ